MSDPVPSFPDDRSCGRVRSVFRSSGYDEETFRSALGLSAHPDLNLVPLPVFREGLRPLSPALTCLFELFIAEATLTEDDLESALCQHLLADLRTAGLLAEAPDGGIRGTVHILPVGDILVASDRRELHARREADMVPGPGGPTRTLLEFAFPGPMGNLLDLGCGPGVLGLLSGAGAARVVSTDINPRALAFTRFNAALNGRENVECREGSLFEPVQGERFDRILCNPPFAISPARTFLYRDGEEGIVRTILREAPGYMAPGGALQMMTEWPEPAGGHWWQWLEEWCRDMDADVHVLRLYSHGNGDHTWRWLVQEHGEGPIPQEVFREWMAYLEDSGIGSVGGGHLVMRRAGSRDRLRTFRKAPARDQGPVGAALLRWVESRELASSVEDSELMDLALAPAPGLEREDRKGTEGEGWQWMNSILRLPAGLRFAARVDPVAAVVVGLLDGRRTPREALARFCGSVGIEERLFEAGLPGALRSLLELGLLQGPRET